MFARSHMHDDVGEEYFHRNPVNAFKHAWNLIVAHDDAERKNENDSEKTTPKKVAPKKMAPE